MERDCEVEETVSQSKYGFAGSGFKESRKVRLLFVIASIQLDHVGIADFNFRHGQRSAVRSISQLGDVITAEAYLPPILVSSRNSLLCELRPRESWRPTMSLP